MPEPTTTKKLWDRTAWKDAAFFLRYLRPHFNVFIPALIALALTAVLTVIFINLLAEVAGKGLGGAQGPEWMAELKQSVLIMVAIVATQAFIAFWRIMLFAKASERALGALRMETFSRIIRLPMGTLNVRRVGELGSRLANDVESMRETLVLTIPMLIRHTVMLLGCLILVLQISVKLALVMIGTIPVVIVMIAIFGARIRKLTRKAQDNLATSQVIVEESLQSIISVKAFANESHEIARYNQNLGNFLTTAIRAAAPRAAFVSFIIFAFSLALIVVTWVALTMLSKGEIPAAELSRFAALSGLIGASFAQFSELFTQLQRTLGATDRVREILQEPTEPEALDAPKTRFRGEIAMEDISFAYATRPDAPVLREFSLNAKAGQRIALVGPSGSGKTTAVALLYRFYEPTSGRIMVDGQPIATMPLPTLRRNLALVPQEVLLFGGSIRENIAYGKPDASEAEIIEAAKKANAHLFIEKLPEGYDTLVGERGTQLSGGQRQRIAIARAILADPAILILDEATSSLDAESERLVQDALDKLMENRTSIIIAHRLSTVRRCDQILVLSAGTIVERGTHEELVGKEGSLYGTLARLQLE
ncbi:ATP-binding cassette subfamily B protein [Prosthecobacter fusiformis]|uniref:ATP-binding cassette subfamily B protein n=1 Tax=Prosthecobacter fusiformis TaxID=48464 RepID=A0A4R7RM86_9BACT|nr:ABC transporter transmembrane domain-containing protein [Prosthecobacter fusiformis]TDU64613.1 ATP-binding cassette subfamily B protein [Prosthecobacter fusiformis]